MAAVSDPRFIGLINGSLPNRSGGHRLVVQALAISTDESRAELSLELLREAAAPELWEVSVPIDPIDLTMSDESFALVLRANLEEWADVRAREPAVAAWGRRRGVPD